VFIETGTYQGESLDLAMHAGYQELHSIEFSKENHDSAKQRFIGKQHVHLYHGTSPAWLTSLINPSMTARHVTFWLDAHFQGTSITEQDASYGQCPLLDELQAIFAHNWPVAPLILIDDAHRFLMRHDMAHDGPFIMAQWPTIDVIVRALPFDYMVTVYEDVIVCQKKTS
jgi:hypothetical protein